MVSIATLKDGVSEALTNLEHSTQVTLQQTWLWAVRRLGPKGGHLPKSPKVLKAMLGSDHPKVAKLHPKLHRGWVSKEAMIIMEPRP